MGIAWCMPEEGHWDTHHDVSAVYPFSKHGPPDQDMTAPLSHYFISSGHNS